MLLLLLFFVGLVAVSTWWRLWDEGMQSHMLLLLLLLVGLVAASTCSDSHLVVFQEAFEIVFPNMTGDGMGIPFFIRNRFDEYSRELGTFKNQRLAIPKERVASVFTREVNRYMIHAKIGYYTDRILFLQEMIAERLEFLAMRRRELALDEEVLERWKALEGEGHT